MKFKIGIGRKMKAINLSERDFELTDLYKGVTDPITRQHLREAQCVLDKYFGQSWSPDILYGVLDRAERPIRVRKIKQAS